MNSSNYFSCFKLKQPLLFSTLAVQSVITLKHYENKHSLWYQLFHRLLNLYCHKRMLDMQHLKWPIYILSHYTLWLKVRVFTHEMTLLQHQSARLAITKQLSGHALELKSSAIILSKEIHSPLCMTGAHTSPCRNASWLHTLPLLAVLCTYFLQ